MNTKDKIVIGVVGRFATGKEEAVRQIENAVGDIFSTSFSAALYDDLKRHHLPATRENLQDFGAVLDKVFGKGIFENTMKGDILAAEQDVVAVTGVRKPSNLKLIQDFPINKVIFIKADPKIRYERLLVQKDGEGKVGENKITWEEFLTKDKHEIEKDIDELGLKADFVIENNGTKEDLATNLQPVIDWINKNR